MNVAEKHIRIYYVIFRLARMQRVYTQIHMGIFVALGIFGFLFQLQSSLVH